METLLLLNTADAYTMRFGTAGYPLTKKTPEDSLRYIRSIGLDALEIEFVRGIHMRLDRAVEIGAKAKELNIRLSCHAPYFINFNSELDEVRKKSIGWVINTARIAHYLGAYIIVIHAASYGKSPETALSSVLQGLGRCKDMLDEDNIKDVILGVETMGKMGQFGTLDEIYDVMKHVSGVRPVLDVAHIHARGHGSLQTRDDMQTLIDRFFSMCGDTAHFHISCIKYGKKGEISHLPLNTKSPDMSLLVNILNNSKQDCTFICESPLIEKDAILFKRMFSGPCYQDNHI